MNEIVRERDSSQKLKMKARADNKANVKPCNISLGEAVLVKSPFSASKGGTVYGPTPMTVVSKKGSMITQSQGTRHFSKIYIHQLLTREMMSLGTVALALQLTRSVFRNQHSLLKVRMLLVQIHHLNPVIHHRYADHPGDAFPERFWTYSLNLRYDCLSLS